MSHSIMHIPVFIIKNLHVKKNDSHLNSNKEFFYKKLWIRGAQS